MGLLQNGQWVDKWYDTKNNAGVFKRQDSAFRCGINSSEVNFEDSQGKKFIAEAGRYQLFVSLACPWAHRTLIFRELKQLQDYIEVIVVDPIMLENGWELSGAAKTQSGGLDYLYQLYLKADKNYEGRVTVPVLWDTKTDSIVCNESADIIRLFNSAFNHLTDNHQDYYPQPQRAAIDKINARVYSDINNGVYRCGFATTQTAYNEAFECLFDALDWLEALLTDNRYLAGSQLTEADWRLFTTLIRFDAVYVGHFKTNRQRIADYPALSNYLRELYQIPGIASTVNIDQIKTHYYKSHGTINPTAIIPFGPEQNFNAPHNRAAL